MSLIRPGETPARCVPSIIKLIVARYAREFHIEGMCMGKVAMGSSR